MAFGINLITCWAIGRKADIPYPISGRPQEGHPRRGGLHRGGGGGLVGGGRGGAGRRDDVGGDEGEPEDELRALGRVGDRRQAGPRQELHAQKRSVRIPIPKGSQFQFLGGVLELKEIIPDSQFINY